MGGVRRTLLLFIALLALAPAGARAQSGALDQLPGAAGCLSVAGPADGCAAAPSLGTPRAIAVSPDGADVVVGSGGYRPDGTEPFLRRRPRRPAPRSRRRLAHPGRLRELGRHAAAARVCRNSAWSTPLRSHRPRHPVAPGSTRSRPVPRSGPRLFEFTREPDNGSARRGGPPATRRRPRHGGTLTLGPGGDTLYVGGDRGLRIFQRWGQPDCARWQARTAASPRPAASGGRAPSSAASARALGEVTSIAIAPGGPALVDRHPSGEAERPVRQLRRPHLLAHEARRARAAAGQEGLRRRPRRRPHPQSRMHAAPPACASCTA